MRRWRRSSVLPAGGRDIVLPAILAFLVVAASVRMGPDAGWDLRNYHVYDAYAYLHGRLHLDLVAAQMQTFTCPFVDLPSFWLRRRLDHQPGLLDALLAAPSAAGVVLAWRIGRSVLPESRTAARISVALAILFGVTGASGLPTVGSSMSEMPSACFALAGLMLLLGQNTAARATLLPGAFFGIAVGLKLTDATLGAAAAVALLTSGTSPFPARVRQGAILGLGVALGATLVAGTWWLKLWSATGNPLFPYFNAWFRSPLIGSTNIVDARFLPPSLPQAIAYPFSWAFSHSRAVSELAVRDPRLAVAYIAAICVLLRMAMRDGRTLVSGRGGFLVIFCCVAFVLWEAEFSILRYLAPIELLSGLVLLVALRPLAGVSEWLPPAFLMAAKAGCVTITVYPDWGRADRTGQALAVGFPPLPANATVLLLTSDPMSYVAAFAPPDVRFIGVDNNIVHPGGSDRLAKSVETAVQTSTGPLYGLNPRGAVSRREAGVLLFYRLTRGACRPVHSNLEPNGLRLCELLRDRAAGPRPRTGDRAG